MTAIVKENTSVCLYGLETMKFRERLKFAWRVLFPPGPGWALRMDSVTLSVTAPDPAPEVKP